MKKNYLVKDKTAVSEIICVTGVERDPSNAFEAATALAEVIKTATECDIEIKSPDARKDGMTEIFIAVAGDGADPSMTLKGDAFSIVISDGKAEIKVGNSRGLWNAMAYFISSFIGYDARGGGEPEKTETISLPEKFEYSFEGTPAAVPLMNVEPEGAFPFAVCGDTYYEQLLRHTAYRYNENPIPCLNSGDYHESMIRQAVAEQRLIWNSTGECRCEYCHHHEDETGEKTYVFCKCPECTAAAEREGTICGAYFELVREAAKRLAAVDPSAYLTIAATSVTLEPPKNYLGDNVRVIVADRTLCSSHPVCDDSCDRNSAFAKKLRAWRKLCGSLFVIDFTSDYYYFPATFPIFDIFRQNVAFYSEIGVDGVLLQFDRMQSELEFSDVRLVLAEALLKRPRMSAEEYSERMDNALVHFYGKEAAPVIREYIDRFTELACDGKCFDTHSRPRDILPAKKKDGSGYDLSFARQAYRLWESIHPHHVALARNEMYLARMLFSEYQANPVNYSKTQYSEWLMDAVDMLDRGWAIEEIFKD